LRSSLRKQTILLTITLSTSKPGNFEALIFKYGRGETGRRRIFKNRHFFLFFLHHVWIKE
jgi:hypothetical protein